MHYNKKKRQKLGIMVETDRFFDHVVNLACAADSRKKDVKIFFTGRGALCLQTQEVRKLAGRARLFVCDASFREFGLADDSSGLEGVSFVTQAVNIGLMKDCDRFVVF